MTQHKIIGRCIVCKKTLENVAKDNNQPFRGTEFFTHGHYGSSITDTMGQTIHYINVCDDCLEKAKECGDCIETPLSEKPREW